MRPSEPAPRLLFVSNQVLDFLEYRMAVARALRRSGFEVHVAVPREPGVQYIAREGISVHRIPLRRLSATPLAELRTLICLIRLYRGMRPTLVHHLCLKPTLYGGIAARIAGVPAVIGTLTGLGPVFTMRTLKMRVLRSLIVGGLRFAFGHPNHRVIIQNPDDRDRLVASRLVPGDRTVLIRGSGVDLSLFAPRPEPDGPPRVLMVSRLLWEKGVGEFIAAAVALHGRGSRARFVLLGEPECGHPDAIPLSTVERWRDSGQVEWLRWRQDMPALIAQSHVVCLPSYYGEGVPRVLIEAAASGRPIVTTDAPGCREVVCHGQNGLLVPARDVEALTGAIARLIEDPPLRAAMGARGREIAVSRFALKKVVDANLAVHRSLLHALARKPSAGPPVPRRQPRSSGHQAGVAGDRSPRAVARPSGGGTL